MGYKITYCFKGNFDLVFTITLSYYRPYTKGFLESLCRKCKSYIGNSKSKGLQLVKDSF